MDSTTLWLVRHGETQWNVEHRIQGHGDSPLTDFGREQARALARELSAVPFDSVWTSSSLRAIVTARLLFAEREAPALQSDDRLREIGHGLWEGLTANEVAARWPALYRAYRETPGRFPRAPGGESLAEVRARAVECLSELARSGGGRSVLVVSHAVTLKAFLSWIEGRPLDEFWAPPYMEPTSVSEVRSDGQRWEIVRYADARHLDALREERRPR